MTLDEAVATIDIPQVEGCAMVFSQTGEEYTVIMSGGPKEEGEVCPILCSTADLAVKLWLEAFNEYAAGKHGVLYWRTRPELGSWEVQQVGLEEFRRTVHVVYSRLLISDKPELAKDHPRVKSYYDDMAKRAA